MADLTTIRLVAEHLIPAHPGPHHHTLRGTAEESHTLTDRNTASVPGDEVERDGDKLMKKTRYAGALIHIGI